MYLGILAVYNIPHTYIIVCEYYISCDGIYTPPSKKKYIYIHIYT